MTQQTGQPDAQKKAKRLYAVLIFFIFVVLVAGVFKLVFPGEHRSSQPARPRVVPVAAVQITKSGFVPATLSVKQGTRVVWTNSDNAMHQVVSNPYPTGKGLSNLKSEILNNNQAYTYTADTTGTFGYHDQIRPTLNGTLVVQKR